MNLRTIFGGVAIGKDTSGNIKPSVKGLAVKVSDTKFVVRDGDSLLDVDGFVIDGGDRYVYRMPVKPDQVEAGDLLITSDDPFHALFVKAVGKSKNGTIRALDPRTSTEVDYIPQTNMFGVRFFVKAISLVEGLGGGGADNLLALLALSEGGLGGLGGGAAAGAAGGAAGGAGGDDNLATLLLLQGFGGKAVDINKLLPFLLLKGKGDSLETILLLQALGINLGNLGGGGQSLAVESSTASLD